MSQAHHAVNFRASVHGFRRIHDVELPITSPITVVIGLNEVGKTSLLRGIGAALAGLPRQFGATQKDARGVLHRASGGKRVTQALAKVERFNGSGKVVGTASASWPDQATPAEGELRPRATVWAAGLGLPFAPETWLRFLQGLLPASIPDEKAIADGLAAAGLAQAEAADIAKALAEGDYDFEQALADCHDKSKGAQGAWRSVTAATYGEKLARTWRPKEWDPRFEEATPEDLRLSLVTAKATQIKAARAGVATEAARLAKQRDQTRDRLLKATEEANRALIQPLREAERAAANTLAHLENLGAPGQGRVLKCAHCGGENVVEIHLDNLPVLAAPRSSDEVAAACEEHDAVLVAARHKHKAAEAALNTAISRDRQPSKAEVDLQTQLDDLDRQLASLGEGAESPAEARARQSVERLEEVLGMVERVRLASQHHAAVVAYRAAMEVLKPTGLRRAILVREVDRTLNPWLARHAPMVFEGQDVIRIDTSREEMPLVRSDTGETYQEITSGGDPNSVALRMAHLMQLMAAAHDGSDLVLLDRCETYANHLIAGRKGELNEGLRALIHAVGVPVVMAMKRDAPQDMVKSIASVLGPTHVLDGGRIVASA